MNIKCENVSAQQHNGMKSFPSTRDTLFNSSKIETSFLNTSWSLGFKLEYKSRAQIQYIKS